MTPHVAVLGAGPAGLGVAWRLARRGRFEVTVLERGAAAGGNAGSFELGSLNVGYARNPYCAPEILVDILGMRGNDLRGRAAGRASGRELGTPVTEVLEADGIPVRCHILEMAGRHPASAYPIYHHGYGADFGRMDDWLNRIDGLVTFGRQASCAHDNAHHALAMADALDTSIRDDNASLDRERWAAHRGSFREHVVED